MNEFSKQIILFDGVCNFCNYWVNFLIDRDKKDVFRFLALQSTVGQKLLNKFELDSTNYDTFILIVNDEYYTKSTAALKIAKELSFPLKAFYYFIIIPRAIRDFIYSIIANNRYKFFGKRDFCKIPTEDEKSRFLDYY